MATKSMADFARQVRQMGSKQEQEVFYEACCKELAARLLRKVIKRTPVGEGTFEVVRDNAGAVQKHKRGKHKGKVKLKRLTNGGTLRRGWTASSEANAKAGNAPGVSGYLGSMNVRHIGKYYEVTIKNVVSYASYVELGHRQQPGRFVPVLGKRLKNGWVEGQFMLKISVDEVRAEARRVLSRKLDRWLMGGLG